jgi:hypothetical protein
MYKRRRKRMTCAVWNAFTIMHARHGCSAPPFSASLAAQEGGSQAVDWKSVLLWVKWTKAVTVNINAASKKQSREVPVL